MSALPVERWADEIGPPGPGYQPGGRPSLTTQAAMERVHVALRYVEVTALDRRLIEWLAMADPRVLAQVADLLERVGRAGEAMSRHRGSPRVAAARHEMVSAKAVRALHDQGRDDAETLDDLWDILGRIAKAMRTDWP